MTTTIHSLLGMGMNFSKKRYEVKYLFMFPFILGGEMISIKKKNVLQNKRQSLNWFLHLTFCLI